MWNPIELWMETVEAVFFPVNNSMKVRRHVDRSDSDADSVSLDASHGNVEAQEDQREAART